mgnify:CR=1 FL=1
MEERMAKLPGLQGPGVTFFTLKAAHCFGLDARIDGLPETHNPYDEGKAPDAYAAWADGWNKRKLRQ